MVLKGAGVRGDEATGVDQTFSNVVSAATTAGAIGGTIARQILTDKQSKEKPEPQRPELNGDLNKTFYQAFIDRGVDKDVAKAAADGLVLGQDASNNPAIAEANRIVEEWGREQTDSPKKSVEAEAKKGELKEEDAQSAQPGDQPLVQAASAQIRNGNGAQTETQPSSKDKEPSTTDTAKPGPQLVSQNAAQADRAENSSASVAKVEFSQPPSEMKWADLQKKASEITAQTGEKAEGRKKEQVLAFVEKYYTEQQNKATMVQPEKAATKEKTTAQDKEESEKPDKQYTSAAVSAPVIRTPIVRQNKPALEEDYNAALEAANVDDETAGRAATAIVAGHDETSSPAIKEAHRQIQPPPRSALQQMYYEVLAKQALDPELVEQASKDLAAGKGALSSKSVRQAHNKILNRELDQTKLPPDQKQWHKHSRYISETDPKKRIQAIANSGAKSELSKKQIGTLLLRYSPEVAAMQKKEGGTSTANFIKSAASSAVSFAKSQSKGQAIKSKKGIEV